MRLGPDEARQRFATGRVAYLATLRPDGTTALVPIVFAVRGDRVLSVVDPKPKRTPDLARLRHIAQDPRVTLLVDHYEDDWQLLWWARAQGEARAVAAGPERDDGMLARCGDTRGRKRGQHKKAGGDFHSLSSHTPRSVSQGPFPGLCHPRKWVRLGRRDS